MEMSSGSGTKAVGGRLAAESLQSVSARVLTEKKRGAISNKLQPHCKTAYQKKKKKLYIFML